MLFKAQVVTKASQKFDIETEKLNVPSSDGRRTILSNHMAIMLPLNMGVIETDNGGLQHYAVDEGILYFENNEAKIITDNFIEVSDINIDEVNSKLREYEDVEADMKATELKQYKWYKNLQDAYNKYKK